MLIVCLLAGIGFVVGTKIWEARDNARAARTTAGPYTASLDSLKKHPLPPWFADAKFGIMIHWGLYSVPGFAPKGKTFPQLLATNYDHALTTNPYAEDYANAMKDPTSPTAAHHRAHYGTAPYSDFARQFEAGLAAWDPNAWATAFKRTGASYVVVTAKYADGYSLWPTGVRNPHAPDFHSRRDLMGELAAAVRKQGLRFGVYYSGGVDWTFQPTVVKTLGDYAYLPYGEDYRAYAVAQVHELVARYKPDILWNDISWPTGDKRLYALIADYYNTVPEGVVNDRWQTSSFGHQLMGWKPFRWGFDRTMKTVLAQPSAGDVISTPQQVPHSDFRTPEYTGFDTIQSTFWQQDRGIGGSFGYNCTETDADYAGTDQLLAELVKAAANNGSFLLNVGPSGGEGTIVPGQLSRLTGIGDWMAAHREALDGTRPWTRSSADTADGGKVAFTRRGSSLYVIVLGRPTGSVTLKGVTITGRATRLGTDEQVSLATAGGDTTITIGNTVGTAGTYAPAFRIDGAT